MPTPLPSPVKGLAAVAVLVVLAGCQPGSNTRPVPSVAQIGSNLKCSSGDHGFEDVQAGWGFCYPGTWRYQEKAQSSQSPAPAELDLTFDITDVGSSNSGLFAFMIISTFDRGGSPSLAAWEQANLPSVPAGQAITWGNATEAAKLADGRRIALTQHHVVIMELHSGQINGCVTEAGAPTPCHLDLEAQMGSRLDTWDFTY
ncbi:MAG: hypothetical protein ACYDA0_08820 [Candidatus Dormibacteraceae bacterium]